MKRNFLLRAGAAAMSIMVALGSSNLCPATQASGDAKAAYRQVVQKIVNEKGISEFNSQFINTDGVASAICVDLFGDSTEELVVVWLEPTTGDVDTYGTSTAICAIYTYKNGTATEVARELENGGFMNIGGNRAGDKFLLTHSITRMTTDGLLWDGSRFVQKSVFDNITQAEQEEIQRASVEQGMSGESNALYSLLLKRCGMERDEVKHIFSVNGQGEITTALDGNYFSPADCIAALGVKEPALSAKKALQKIAYYGDRSKCKMSSEMALAYADAIESISGDNKAVLMDIADDGMPILITAKSDWADSFKIWSYNGNKAVAIDPEKDGTEVWCGYHFGYYDKIPAIYASNESRRANGDLWYKVSNGKISVLHFLEIKYGEDYNIEQYLWDGTPISDDSVSDYTSKWEVKYSIFSENGPYHRRPKGDWTNADTMATLLAQYATGLSDYPNFSKVDSSVDTYAEEIANVIAKEVGGEIKGIYKISEGVYYIVIIIDGTEKGALVEGSRKDGEIVWKVTQKDEAPIEPSELDKIAVNIAEKSNINIDINKAASFSDVNSLNNYLQKTLDNMDGITPNDAAKTELLIFIESSLSNICTDKTSSWGNRITLDAKSVGDCAKKAQDAKAQVEKLLSDNNVTLSKDITVIVHILWKNCKSKKPCQITLDSTLAQSLDGCTLRLLLGESQYYVQISADRLKKLIEENGTVIIQFSKAEDNIYTINFVNEDEQIIEQISEAITFGLPAENALSTIMASYKGGSDNWGGQYDQNTKTISFETRFSGQYEVLENNIQIDDIAELPEESQEAIRFLVSKGFLTLDENKFLPQNHLARYEFTKALVGMFFALDRDLNTTFTDVPKDSEYYPYVASAQQRNIVEGFDETTFGGEINMTVEQMIALAARTLVDQKGYSLPTDADSYLVSFENKNEIGAWARELVALAVREGIIDRDYDLNPQADITREQAAVILYRLFMLLYEVPPVGLNVSGNTVGIIAGSAGGVAVLGGGAALWYFMKKKRRQKISKNA